MNPNRYATLRLTSRDNTLGVGSVSIGVDRYKQNPGVPFEESESLVIYARAP